MTLGVNGITSSIIDATAVNQIADQIFTTADNKKIQFGKFDFTKFQRPEMGVDFYNQRVDIEKTQQITVRNAGLDINLNQANVANIQYLNSQAALNAYNARKAVDGKVYVPKEGTVQDVGAREVFALPASLHTNETTDLGRDKRGSNPFVFISTNSKSEEEDSIIAA